MEHRYEAVALDFGNKRGAHLQERERERERSNVGMQRDILKALEVEIKERKRERD